jgi:hypothetical protein
MVLFSFFCKCSQLTTLSNLSKNNPITEIVLNAGYICHKKMKVFFCMS